jgi:hypothetical protein
VIRATLKPSRAGNGCYWVGFFSVLLLSMADFSELTAADVANGKGESNRSYGTS